MELVLSTESLHAACGLARRENGEWFQVVSLIDSHLPLASSEDVTVLVEIELRGRFYVGGQVGSAIQTIDVEASAGRTPGHIDDRWWGASFPSDEGLLDDFLDFAVSWATTNGAEGSAAGIDLRPPTPAGLCAQNDECRGSRLAELRELAKGLPVSDQAVVLQDGALTGVA